MSKLNEYEVETIITVYFKVKSTELAKNKTEASRKGMNAAINNHKYKLEGSFQRGAYPSYVIRL